MKMADFVPETYKLDERNDREKFLEVYKGISFRRKNDISKTYVFKSLLLYCFTEMRSILIFSFI